MGTGPSTSSRPRPTAPERIQTARMDGERLRLDDNEELTTLLLDPRVARTMWSAHEMQTPEHVGAGLVRKLQHWDRHGFGQWLFRDRATGSMIGRGGPQHTLASGRDEVEIGWVIVPERWGEGLATELARASLEVVFGPLDLHEVIAYTQPDNVASRRVMEKTGLHYEREISYEGEHFVLYRKRAARR
jgi:RimJ/RimL family protein N-acetyltransferase